MLLDRLYYSLRKNELYLSNMQTYGLLDWHARLAPLTSACTAVITAALW